MVQPISDELLDDEYVRWATAIEKKSNFIVRFLQDEDQLSEHQMVQLNGTSLKNEIVRFLSHQSSSVSGVVRLWKHKPHITLHFPAFIRKPVNITVYAHVVIDLPTALLTKDENYGWIYHEDAPEPLKVFLRQFYQKKDLADQLYQEYAQLRDSAYQELIQDQRAAKEYQEFFQQTVDQLNKLNSMLDRVTFSDGFSYRGKPLKKDQAEVKVSHLLMSMNIEDELKPEVKALFDSVKLVYNKLALLHTQSKDKLQDLFTLPQTLNKLGPEKARVLGFLPPEVTTLASQIEWSALSNQPFFWFESDKGNLHDIQQINWDYFLRTDTFSVSVSIEDCTFIEEESMEGWMLRPQHIGEEDSYNYGSEEEEEEEEEISEFNELLIDLSNETLKDFNETERIIYEISIERPVSVKKWLEGVNATEKFLIPSDILILDPLDFAEIAGFPSETVVFSFESGKDFLALCWEYLQEQYKNEILHTYRKKYAIVMEQQLDYLFSDVGKDITQIRQEVEKLVTELSRVSTQLETAQKTILELAGGWTPTWVEKELYIIKKVLENADGNELTREELLTKWKDWLLDHNIARSERELRYNLRGLERTNVLKEYGIHTKNALQDGAGAKKTLFYLHREINRSEVTE